jgi:hypothetical protein
MSLCTPKKLHCAYLISVTSDFSKSSSAILAASKAGRASARESSASFCTRKIKTSEKG